jgi:hypothetical protein
MPILFTASSQFVVGPDNRLEWRKQGQNDADIYIEKAKYPAEKDGSR